ncbi:MAG: hypothetical protein AAF562_06665 [Pseudomonadota bacterium]
MDNPDQALGVEFFTKPIQNGTKSAEAGRPIYDDREFVRITFPADNKRELVAPAHEMHLAPHHKEQMTYAQRFQGSYEAFKDGQDDFISGTPLAVLQGMTDARREELKALKIRTVEQLAGLPDAALKKMGMGAREIQESAKAFLDSANQAADVQALQDQIKVLQAQVRGQNAPDPFADMEIDDLKNMIRDAGAELPRGNASRDTLIARLNEIAEAKADA